MSIKIRIKKTKGLVMKKAMPIIEKMLTTLEWRTVTHYYVSVCEYVEV